MIPGRAAILHVVSGDLWAGAEVAVCNLLRQLRRDPQLAFIVLAFNEGTLTKQLRDLGIETHVVPEAATSFAGLCLAARRLLKGRRVEAIHAHGYKEDVVALLVARLLGVKRLASTVHGLAEPHVRSTARSRAATSLDDLVLRRFFDRVVAVSHEMKQALLADRLLPEWRVEVIHNGVPLPAAAPRPRRAPAVVHVGSVGRMVPVKRFDLFLEVAALVRRATGAVRFSVLGDGALRSELVARARALELSDCVDFLPAQADPLSYYRSLDIYMNTSLHEGLPLSVLEAMSCGIPVVARRVGGIPEIVSSGADGLLVDTDGPDALARACIALATNTQLRGAMGEGARRKVAAEFSDTTMADGYRRLYADLARQTGVRACA